MSKCISCSCTGYKEATQPKSTLLQFRQNCKECGHQASEHRELTPVDRFIKSEVAKAKRNKCLASLSASEIPLSPIFGQYDLIPLPSDDPSYVSSTENSIQCICKGFVMEDVIRLCQKFRTHSYGDVTVDLKDVPCTFCTHPLSCHAPPVPDNDSADLSNLFINRRPALGVYEGLVLTHSLLLPFPPINSDCLGILLPANFIESSFSVLSIGNFLDSDLLGLAVMNQVVTAAANDIESPSSNELDTALNSVSRKRLNEEQASSASARKNQRKSKRIAMKKTKKAEKEMLKQLKGFKGVGRQNAFFEEMEEEVDFTPLECKQVFDSVLSFAKKANVQDNYVTYTLPQELLGGDVKYPVLCTLRVTDHCAPQESMADAELPSSSSGILVTVSAKDSSAIFVTVVPSEGATSSLQWRQINYPQTPAGTVGCLFLKEAASGDNLENGVLLGAGLSSGMVSVWKIILAKGRIEEVSDSLNSFSCPSQCAVLSCSPDSRLLVAGTVLGEVVFCPITSGEAHYSHQQVIRCCSAPVRCFAWTDDGRTVAVGGCDDAIQVLQCATPAQVKSVGKGSLLNYFKRTESYRHVKYEHTYTLQGHTSFIADLQFAHSSLLISLGWDGQLLFWKLLPLPAVSQQGRHHQRSRALVERTPELVEPTGGYKIGPSVLVEILPIMLCSLMGPGLVVAMANKLGGVTVAGYTKPLL